jgi:hypothetical protein
LGCTLAAQAACASRQHEVWEGLAMLVRAYGLYWNPDIVEWGKKGKGNKGRLLGTGKPKDIEKSIDIDVWTQHGVYLLQHEFKCVYVGQTLGQFLGKRLRDHLTDRFAGRWDMFSWFGIDTVNKDGTLRKAGQRQIKPDEMIRSIEALGILFVDPPLNRKRESLSKALLIDQRKGPQPHTIRHYLEKLLSHHEALNKKLKIRL